MRQHHKQKNVKGFSLAEILVALGVFSMIVVSIGTLVIETSRFSENRWFKVMATAQIQEIINGVNINKQDFWANIVNHSDGNDKHLVYSGETYSIVNGAATKNGITLNFNLTNAFRDASGNIVESGGTSDLGTRLLTITASWTDTLGIVNSTTSRTYISNWNTYNWTKTASADFNIGTHDATIVEGTSGGEVALENVLYSDWCTPELTQASYNLPGSSEPTLINSLPGTAYLGSANTSASLRGVDVNHSTTPATVTVEGSFNGYVTKSIFGDGTYAYLATTNDSKEIVIVDTTTNPYKEVGYFNASGSTDAESVYVVGNVGYMLQGRNLRTFDLSSKNGSRPQLDSLTVANGIWGFFVGVASEIEVRNNYAFISLYNDWYELKVVNVSNPNNLSEVGNADVNFQQSSDLFVNENGTRVYIGTTSASSSDEFFIIDTSVKKSGMPVIASYDTNGMSVRGVTVIDDKAIIVGTGGEEYQVVDIPANNNLTRCGGLNIDSGLNGVTTIVTPGMERYSYIIGSDVNNEFRVIKGGITQGHPGGLGYADEGTYTSEVFDTSSAQTKYYYLRWTEQLPSNTDLRIQIRSGDSSNLTSVPWVGPNGASGTYFTTPDGETIPATIQNKRYIQFRAIFSSDTISTPVLEDITLNYQP